MGTQPGDQQPTSEAPEAEAATALAQRRCGRCQVTFAGDPDLWFQTDWALCPSCQAILLPDKGGSSRTG